MFETAAFNKFTTISPEQRSAEIKDILKRTEAEIDRSFQGIKPNKNKKQ